MASATASSILAQNAAFRARKVPGGAALFVGGTSGIGLATMKAYTNNTDSPRIYFAGRNATAASKITSELQSLNPTAKITFLQVSDLSLVAEADKLAKTFTSLEPGPLSLLLVSCGTMNAPSPFKRIRTSEGIDPALSLNMFTRLHIVRSLLPNIRAAAADENRQIKPAVVSIYASEHGAIVKHIDTDDLRLDKPGAYSAYNAANLSSAVQSVTFDYISKESEGKVRTLHVNPGIVPSTGYVREWPKIIGWVAKVLMYPIADKAEEVGEGVSWLATREDGGDDKQVHMVDWRGRSRVARWWPDEEPAKVWKSLGEVTERILKGEFKGKA